MNKYLIVSFDRYETADSTERFVEHEGSMLEALLKGIKYQEEIEFLTEMFQQVRENFGCVSDSEEESGILVYKLN